MPSDAAKFSQIDTMWRSLMSAVANESRVLEATSRQGLLDDLRQAFAILEDIQKGLQDYLEKKRVFFSRSVVSSKLKIVAWLEITHHKVWSKFVHHLILCLIPGFISCPTMNSWKYYRKLKNRIAFSPICASVLMGSAACRSLKSEKSKACFPLTTSLSYSDKKLCPPKAKYMTCLIIK